MTWFRQVTENVARNPVARAVAKRNIMCAVRDFQTNLYELGDGVDAKTDIAAAMSIIGLASQILAINTTIDRVAVEPINRAVDLLAAMNGKWSAAAAGEIDDALTLSMEIHGLATADQTRQAWLRIQTAGGGEE